MAFGGFNDSKQQAPMSDINVTPMVDVMLVLLVIFIITAPLLTHSVLLELPQAQSAPSQEKPATVTLSIDADGNVYWNNERLDHTALESRLQQAAALKPQPDLQLRADKSTRYEVVAQVMSRAQRAGISRLGFLTDGSEP